MAIDLFVEHGYEATTVEDICAVAGISRSTFFRYFNSKEDVLIRELDDFGEILLSALQDRPDDEPAWLALQGALSPLTQQTESSHALRSARLVRATPALATFRQEKQARWGELLRQEIARRIGSDPGDLTDPRPSALIGAALACVDAAVTAWAAADAAQPLADLLDRAMQTVG